MFFAGMAVLEAQVKSKMRISKDDYFLKLADVVAERGTCPRKKIGAVLVRDGMILSTGYNGAPRGIEHCETLGCRMANGHCVRTIHAEVNAVIQAAYHGVSTKGSVMYTQVLPCEYCSKVLINAGVVEIVYCGEYENNDNVYTKKILRKAKVKLRDLTRGKK